MGVRHLRPPGRSFSFSFPFGGGACVARSAHSRGEAKTTKKAPNTCFRTTDHAAVSSIATPTRPTTVSIPSTRLLVRPAAHFAVSRLAPSLSLDMHMTLKAPPVVLVAYVMKPPRSPPDTETEPTPLLLRVVSEIQMPHLPSKSLTLTFELRVTILPRRCNRVSPA
jgi:hypothetical protein